MLKSFALHKFLSSALASAFLFGVSVSVAQDPPVEKLDDKSTNYVAVTIFSEEIPPHRRLNNRSPFRLSTTSDTPGYMQLMFFSKDKMSRIEGEKLEVLSFPEFDYREGPDRPIRSWPLISWPTVETINMESWIEDRRDEGGIKVPTTFKMFKAVLSSTAAGVRNKVTIFATDYDHHPRESKKRVKIDKNWIVVSMESAEKIFDHVEAGSDVVIRTESVDD